MDEYNSMALHFFGSGYMDRCSRMIAGLITGGALERHLTDGLVSREASTMKPDALAANLAANVLTRQPS